MNLNKFHTRHQSQPTLWSLHQPQHKPNTRPKINHKRIVLPVIPQNPAVGYYSPNLQSIYSNPKIARMRSVTKIPTTNDYSLEKVKPQQSNKKSSQKLTILEMMLKEVDEEVDQDLRENPKCAKTPLQLQPLNDNFIEQLKYLKLNLQRLLRKKI
ncbi:unnamed protein product [Paramecium pentaurelia]|uniref:Uncharacterized protein n=1 Tax=Paramecium pentaurelia TaxID=43138 RepID=A0A8S1Y9Q9_9CILI|nr:unnamed protein product [Paramecium pentaurelia]